MNALKQYIDLYDENRELIEQQSPALLNKLRALPGVYDATLVAYNGEAI